MARVCIISMVGAGALGACAAPGAVPDAAGRAEVPVTVDGARFLAAVGPGLPGEKLGATGAAPARGLTVAVTREGAPLHYSDGIAAKAAARAGCEGAGRRFDAAALGRYAAPGTWQFAGACA